ncbi:hypothetical protein AnigIFM50267_003558 [Aspergillus niger]|nr:hypothetical protein AnigIFM50267_003558 [Aspergillus niger]
MMIPPKRPTTQKRESRAEARKVTSLSAERLERKRANDREAQRTIRQRTREHIEQLEHQVAKLKAEREQFDDVVRRNVMLEHEIRALKHQLALASRQGYLETYSNTPESMLPATQFAELLGLDQASRAASVLSKSSHVSVGSEWQSYSTAWSPSTCESTKTNYGNRVESYLFENQLQLSSTITVAPSQVTYSAPVGAQPGPMFEFYAQAYHTGNTSPGPVDGLASHSPQPVPYVPGHQLM